MSGGHLLTCKALRYVALLDSPENQRRATSNIHGEDDGELVPGQWQFTCSAPLRRVSVTASFVGNSGNTHDAVVLSAAAVTSGSVTPTLLVPSVPCRQD